MLHREMCFWELFLDDNFGTVTDCYFSSCAIRLFACQSRSAPSPHTRCPVPMGQGINTDCTRTVYSQERCAFCHLLSPHRSPRADACLSPRCVRMRCASNRWVAMCVARLPHYPRTIQANVQAKVHANDQEKVHAHHAAPVSYTHLTLPTTPYV